MLIPKDRLNSTHLGIKHQALSVQRRDVIQFLFNFPIWSIEKELLSCAGIPD